MPKLFRRAAGGPQSARAPRLLPEEKRLLCSCRRFDQRICADMFGHDFGALSESVADGKFGAPSRMQFRWKVSGPFSRMSARPAECL